MHLDQREVFRFVLLTKQGNELPLPFSSSQALIALCLIKEAVYWLCVPVMAGLIKSQSSRLNGRALHRLAKTLLSDVVFFNLICDLTCS